MRNTAALAFLGAVLLALPAGASDPTGIYALVDKVVLEPAQGEPERVQIWGVFALAEARRGDNYIDPARGYLYCSLRKDKESVCRIEWADLKKLAGTGQALGMGSRYYLMSSRVRVRKATEKPEGPDTYPLGWGLQKLDANHYMAVQLRSLPTPVSPAEGEAVKAGPVTLAARKMLHEGRKNVRYHFEIVGPKGESEKSPAVAAEDKQLRWTPKLSIAAGQHYTWRVWAAEGEWKGPVSSVEFKGAAAQ